MSESAKILGTAEAWESGELGMNPETMVQASPEDEAKLDAALNLKMISIRLQTQLIEDFKELAKDKGIGYQTLMRMVLNGYVNSEKEKLKE